MILSQSQYYDVIQYVQSKGLDPKLFTLEHQEKEEQLSFWRGLVAKPKKIQFSVISIQKTDYCFEAEVNHYTNHKYTGHIDNPEDYIWFGPENDDQRQYNTEYTVSFSPGSTYFTTRKQGIGYRQNFDWHVIFQWSKVWVDNLVDEIHAIEQLSRINMIPEFFSDARSYQDFKDRYSGQQGEMIKEKVRLLKSRVQEEIPLTQDQATIINQKLDELMAKVDQSNKFDFRTFFFGVLTNIASSVLYDNAPTFWGIVKSIFGEAMLGGGDSGRLV